MSKKLLVEEVSTGAEKPQKLEGPASVGAETIEAAKDSVATAQAAAGVTKPAPYNKTSPVTGQEGIVTPEASVASVEAGSKETTPAKPNETTPVPPKTKGGLINAMYTHMVGLSLDELTLAYDAMLTKAPLNTAGGGEPQHKIEDPKPAGAPMYPADTAAKEAGVKLAGLQKSPGPDKQGSQETVAATVPTTQPATDGGPGPQAPEKTAEALTTLMSAEKSLSEDFRKAATGIFESAIKERVATHVTRIEENYRTQLAEEVTKIEIALGEKIDKYLKYVVESWMKENQVALERGLRTEIAEGFIEGLKNLFKESYIEVPEGKENLVDELNGETSKLEEQVLKATEANMLLTEEVVTLKRAQVLAEASKGLAATEAAKLVTLTADVDFDSSETFGKKVEVIKESFFKKTPVKTETKPQQTETRVLTEDGKTTIVEETDDGKPAGAMGAYSDAITRTVKNQQ